MGVMTTIAAVGAIASVGSSVSGAIGQNKKAKAYEKALNSYERQELTNPYENLQVSTVGTDLALQENSRNTQSMIDVMQKGGINGLAMLPQIQAGTNDLNLQVGANLDQQYIDNENKKADGDVMVMQMQEQRENGDLAGLGQAMTTAQQNSSNSLGNAVNGLTTGAMSVAGTYQNQQMLNTLNGSSSPRVSSGMNLNSPSLQMPEIVPIQNPVIQGVSPSGLVSSMPQTQSIFPSVTNPGFSYEAFNKFRNRGK